MSHDNEEQPRVEIRYAPVASNLRVIAVFLLGISVGVSMMYLYMLIRNPDPFAELKKHPEAVRGTE